MTRWATLAIATAVFRHRHRSNTPAPRPARPATAGSRCSTARTWTTGTGDGNATFEIEDGAVVADKKDPKAVAAYLVTKKSYKDFELHAEFWVSDDANSGIFIRCSDPEEDRRQDLLRGQHLRPAHGPDLRHRRDRLLSPRSTRCPRPAASGTPRRSPPRAAHLTVMLNGKKTVDDAQRHVRRRTDRAAVRRRHGEVPQGRDQAAVKRAARPGAEPSLPSLLARLRSGAAGSRPSAASCAHTKPTERVCPQFERRCA